LASKVFILASHGSFSGRLYSWSIHSITVKSHPVVHATCLYNLSSKYNHSPLFLTSSLHIPNRVTTW
jgi:hypothetical protein